MDLTQGKGTNKTPTTSSATPTSRTYDPDSPIREQKDPHGSQIILDLLALWGKVRLEILQIPPVSVPVDSTEELRIIERMCRKYGTLTPKEFAGAIRNAANEKARWMAANPNSFPKLYGAEIEEMVEATIQAKNAKAEADAAKPQLPSHTGGNAFWGDPAAALQREWPRIVKQTKTLRDTLGVPRLRDRFWCGGSAEQRGAAVAMLRQMIAEMHEAGKWDRGNYDWQVLAVFQAEFCHNWPQYGTMVEGMDRNPTPEQLEALRAKLNAKLVYDKREPSAPTIEDFPDWRDCQFCATFDAYWKFTQND